MTIQSEFTIPKLHAMVYHMASTQDIVVGIWEWVAVYAKKVSFVQNVTFPL